MTEETFPADPPLQPNKSFWDRRAYGSRWTTADEIRFLNGLGQHSGSKKKVLLVSERIELLKKYLEGNTLRSIWGDIDPKEVRRYAENLIRNYESLSKKKGSE